MAATETENGNATERVVIWIPAGLKRDLEKIAQSRGIGLSTLCRMLLFSTVEPRK